jgi:micrococcal nuclease
MSPIAPTWVSLALVLAAASAGTARSPTRPPIGDSLPDASPPAPPDSSTVPCTVFRVDDGDTIECESQGRVRLVGIDAPEQDQAFGHESTAGARALLPVNAVVRLETDAEARDRYGRLLAYLWRDGALVNWVLVRRGLAYSYHHPPNLRYARWLDGAETRASAAGEGLWAAAGEHCRPVDHRRHRC